jgi:O-antigen/teichoic acid export membrane protein
LSTSLAKRSSYAFFWSISGSFIALIIQIYAAKSLGASEFGKANVILGLAMAYAFTIHFGLPLQLIRDSNSENSNLEHTQKLLTQYFSIYFLFDLLLLVPLALTCNLFLSNTQLNSNIDIVFCIGIAVLTQFSVLFYRYLEAQRKQGFSSFLKNFISRLVLLLTLILLLNTSIHSYTLLLIATTVSLLIPLIISLFHIKYEFHRPNFSVLRTAFPYYVGSLCYNFYYGMSRYLQNTFTSEEQVAYLSIAITIGNLFLLINNALTSVSMPEISKTWSSNNKQSSKKLHKLYKQFTRWNILILLPAVVFVIFNLDFLLSFLGSSYLSAKQHIIYMILASCIISSTGVAHALLNMTKYSKVEMLNGIMTLVIGLSLGVLLGPLFNVGITLSLSLSLSLVALARVAQVKYLLGIFPYTLNLMSHSVLITATSVIIFFSFTYIDNSVFLLAFQLLTAIALTILSFLTSPETEDRALIRTVIKKIGFNKN